MIRPGIQGFLMHCVKNITEIVHRLYSASFLASDVISFFLNIIIHI